MVSFVIWHFGHDFCEVERLSGSSQNAIRRPFRCAVFDFRLGLLAVLAETPGLAVTVMRNYPFPSLVEVALYRAANVNLTS